MAKRFDREEEPNEFMEAPCRCDCGNWFDLEDGYNSIKNPGKVICGDCDEAEQAEARIEEEVEEYTNELDDAVATIKYRLPEFKKKFPAQFQIWLNKHPEPLRESINTTKP